MSPNRSKPELSSDPESHFDPRVSRAQVSLILLSPSQARVGFWVCQCPEPIQPSSNFFFGSSQLKPPWYQGSRRNFFSEPGTLPTSHCPTERVCKKFEQDALKDRKCYYFTSDTEKRKFLLIVLGFVLPSRKFVPSAGHHALLESYFEIQGDCPLKCQFGWRFRE